jgi:diguanylate cyclase (GGDEF)-like protein/PAS domain S-box-containing protein
MKKKASAPGVQSPQKRKRSPKTRTPAAVKRKTPSASISSLHLGNSIFMNATEGILITDLQGTILTVNPAFTGITGLFEKEVVGKNALFLYSDRKNRKIYKEVTSQLKKTGKWQGEIWTRKRNGENHPLLATTVLHDGDTDRPGSCLSFITDITHHIDNSQQLHNHAYYDTLTGLPNRRLLADRLTFMINRSKRNNSLLSLLLLDLSRFHSINDTLGFATGDLLLQAMGTRLKSCVREVDAVFRLGDDDFALILEGISQPDDASKVAKRILSTCATPFHLSNHEVFAAASIGISMYPSDGSTIEQLMKNSQAALTRAKEFGTNHFQHYQPNMNAKVIEEFTLENDLRKALQRNELVVYYQPQIDLVTRKVTGSEALIRWMHPKLGMVPPGKFVHLAESNGLIIPIGEWVLKTACAQTKKWQEQYSKNLSVAVNLSNRQFQQQDLVAMVARALKDTGLAPESLELEITESMGMRNPAATLKTLQELKSMGARIAIDDFGTGYSSIYYLKKFPIDTIKIDRSFVDDIVTDPNDAVIVLAMIALAHSLKLTVVAEGVENKEQLEYLLNNGCKRIQGFFYSPPVNPHAFEQLLTDPMLVQNIGF